MNHVFLLPSTVGRRAGDEGIANMSNFNEKFEFTVVLFPNGYNDTEMPNTIACVGHLE